MRIQLSLIEPHHEHPLLERFFLTLLMGEGDVSARLAVGQIKETWPAQHLGHGE